ncbi:hypothetical protein [Senegalimassilia anaerobia]|uniref:hypothetical protein n=1 Tax=Senegalimassilia anaerobia TaxID=1473216 RepID=UPI00248DF7A8|nr:hypothetical protein [Senegalimassilia anaerobia]
MSDSFEEIIEGACLGPCSYAHTRGSGPGDSIRCIGCMFSGPGSCDEKMRSDLVRRCKDVAAGEPRSGCEVADDKSAGRSVSIGEVATFPGAKADKAQALKVLEEAAEVFGAWQVFDDYEPPSFFAGAVLDECADVIQATCNLLAALGMTDFEPYMEDCHKRNEERGRL